ncbi:MAG: glycosyltransferase [Pseudomonadota bacterium]
MARLLAHGGHPGDGLDRVDMAPIGHILTRMGALDQGKLDAALTQQNTTGRRLGEVLLAQSAVGERELTAAIAEQWNLGVVDLVSDPPDTDLINPADLEAYIAHRVLPWRRLGAMTTYVIVEPQQAGDALAALGGSGPFAFFALATPGDLQNALSQVAGPQMAARAASRTPAQMSVRSLARVRVAAAVALLAVTAGIIWGGPLAVAGGLLCLFVLNAATTVLRLAALLAGRHHRPEPIHHDGAIEFAQKRGPPKISIMVPLYREAGMVPRLLASIERLDYPRELTEVLLLLEEGDEATHRALDAITLPGWIRCVTVPEGSPRTKPRALNYALDFADGEIIGILDAEDQPAPDQLTQIAEYLRAAPTETACVQCQLSYFNARENWITRCFQIEYSIWFEVLLRGFQTLRLPIPLGGTSVYFRRSALRALGAWDAHNVTEDADLGMRLSRAGMNCAVSTSVTLEEANCRPISWIRQRSRWLKGYILTWLSHMRAPIQLWHELGARGFFAFNILFLGAAATYLAMPLFWLAVFCWLTTGQTIWSSSIPGWAIWPAAISLGVGQLVMLGCAALAMVRRGTPLSLIWVPTLPIYWTLGAVAAWKAVIELFLAPFYWDKTAHGLSRQAADQ